MLSSYDIFPPKLKEFGFRAFRLRPKSTLMLKQQSLPQPLLNIKERVQHQRKVLNLLHMLGLAILQPLEVPTDVVKSLWRAFLTGSIKLGHSCVAQSLGVAACWVEAAVEEARRWASPAKLTLGGTSKFLGIDVDFCILR